VDDTEPAPHDHAPHPGAPADPVIVEAVLAAARRRAGALAERDEATLRALLHPAFGWTSHTGARFDRERYLRSNIDGATIWHGQRLEGTVVAVEGDVAVLSCVVADDVTVNGRRRVHRMPMTQTWVRVGEQWQLLAGHAGPLLGETLVTT
jgi:hypothetical protein